MKDGSWAGGRVQARLLIQDPDGRVLLLALPDGEDRQLPGGPLARYDSLVEAARRGGEQQLGGIVTVGAPLSVSLSQRDGLMVILSGDVFETAVPSFVDPAGRSAGLAEAVGPGTTAASGTGRHCGGRPAHAQVTAAGWRRRWAN